MKNSFSKSQIWQLQNQTYQELGPEAWASKGVPFYLTSNPLIAKQFADVIKTLDNPLIFDLGAGSGRLAYLILKELEGKELTYVMTDIVDQNIHTWENHPQLRSFIEKGILKFKKWSFDQELDLEINNRPVVLVCTYFFDTIPQDLYKVENGKLLEGTIVLENCDTITDLKWHFEYHAVSEKPRYENPLWNKLLEEYSDFNGSTFLFPTATLQVIDTFAKFSKGNLIILAADQGVATVEQVKNWGEPKISKHASFSMAVSYHALQRYLELLGGGAHLPEKPDTKFVVMVGWIGEKPSPLQGLAPIEYLHLTDLSDEQLKEKTLQQIFELIEMGEYDPINFHLFFPAIHEKIHTLDPDIVEKFIVKVYEKFYQVSKEEGDFVLNLGVLLYELKKYKEALFYFHQALKIKGASPLIFYNIAECYRAMKLE